jgi:predicted transcriptional regulator
MVVMAANLAALAGAQVFRTADAPLYIHGFTATLSLSAVCVLSVIAQLTWYFASNRRIARFERTGSGEVPVIEGKAHDLNGEEKGGEKGVMAGEVTIVKTWYWVW